MKAKKLFFSALLATAFLWLPALSLRAAAANSPGLSVSPSTGYTYENGVLTFVEDGTYTISMADGAAETSDQIALNPANLSKITLVLQDLHLSTSEDYNVYCPGGQEIELTIVPKGENVLSAKKRPVKNQRSTYFTTVDGPGTLTLTAAEPDQNGWSSKQFTLKSGTVTLNNSSITTHTGVEISGGTLKINGAPENAMAGIYTNGSYVQTGGTVTVTTKCAAGLFIAGTNENTNPGFQISGGSLSITAPNSGIFASNPPSNAQKDVIINTDGTVSISAPYGIYLRNKSDLYMQNGTLTIRDASYGIIAYDAASEVYVSGGETEVSSSTNAILLSKSEQKSLIIDPDYFHKSYRGDDEGSRKETADSEITDSQGKSVPYVLITPAYTITYDLGEGILPAGPSNPVKYSRADSFTLINPEPKNAGALFTGWTGTGLSGPTTQT